MKCPTCSERFRITFLFDAEITYPFKRGGTNVTYDYSFFKCKNCQLEFAVKDDGFKMREVCKKREKIRSQAGTDSGYPMASPRMEALNSLLQKLNGPKPWDESTITRVTADFDGPHVPNHLGDGEI